MSTGLDTLLCCTGIAIALGGAPMLLIIGIAVAVRICRD